MAATPRAARVFTSIAAMRAAPGFRLAHYAVALDSGLLYQWKPDDTTTADDWSIVTHTGGYAGRWHHVPGDDKGADLANSDETLTVAGKFTRYMQAAVLTANRVKTLGTAGAIAGQRLTIVRLDAGAFTLTIANGGGAGGNVAVLPVSERWSATARFDGANWIILRAGKLP